jgi:hypothetical protein
MRRVAKSLFSLVGVRFLKLWPSAIPVLLLPGGSAFSVTSQTAVTSGGVIG